jgi:intraflagellar transport protein 81
LILGDRTLITHILNWLLNKLPALKKRAYLAKFLVKIELSPDVEGDHDILLIYQQVFLETMIL